MAKKPNLTAATTNPNTRAILEASGVQLELSAPHTPPQETAPESAGSAYDRTTRGYKTKDGTEKIRVSLHLTRAQRERLKQLAFDAKKDVSDYVADRLGL